MLDFKEAGELGVFIDEEQLKALEDKMKSKGFLEGSDMATTFNMLRANDLIWSFVVNNYLMGNEPFPFDLLYWNSDATRACPRGCTHSTSAICIRIICSPSQMPSSWRAKRST
jgi:poly(3-hydroxyalkanoate) synthetase